MNQTLDELLSEDERVDTTASRHWIIIFWNLFGVLILVLAPIVLTIVYTQFGSPLTSNQWLFVGGGFALWLLLLWIRMFVVLTDFYLDRWYITNERIIDVEQRGLFSRRVSSMPLANIQDVTVDVHGPLATFLTYGTIHVQSAGSATEFELATARKPHETRKRIADLQEIIDT